MKLLGLACFFTLIVVGAGGYLVEPKTRNELAFIRTHMITDINTQYWTGIKYDTGRSTFIFRDYETFQLNSSWLPNEPNYSGKCVRLASAYNVGTSHNKTFMLQDVGCTVNNRIICQKPAVYDSEFIYTYSETNVTGRRFCFKERFIGVSWRSCMFTCDYTIECVGFTSTSETCVVFKFKHDCSDPVGKIYVRTLSRCDRATRMDLSWPLTYE